MLGSKHSGLESNSSSGVPSGDAGNWAQEPGRACYVLMVRCDEELTLETSSSAFSRKVATKG